MKELFEKYQKFKVVDVTCVCVVYKFEMPSHDLWLMGHCIVGVWITACDCAGMILLTA